MRNYFTITISDVHGARHYSFKQFVRKFVWIVLTLILAIWVVGGISIWWLSSEASQVEGKHQVIVDAFVDDLKKTQADYEGLLVERARLEQDLQVTSSQVAFLDQTLQGLEELVGDSGYDAESTAEGEVASFPERIKQVQLSSLGKDLMLSMIPSGKAVGDYRGITSPYGKRNHPITGKTHKHGGIDYRGRRGAAVIATADGMVSFSGLSKDTGFGNLISIMHANGFRTLYGHLNKRLVKSGQYVKKGEKIGEIGSTGRSSGNHLHYEVWFLYRRLDPKFFNDWSMEKYDDLFTEVKGVPWGSLSQAVANRVKRVEKQLLLRDVPLMARSLN
ncbi:MAG: hypothetical protein ISEC1_P1204 [Thiomicrorhabdus sp.]|nr:MAG: hypothetical protein ISEC1_P1204 [Thiomicrorhabdus sp.]